MVVKNLSDDQQFTAEFAWSLASRKRSSRECERGVLITNEPNNLRMQELIVEWALSGYLPAQQLWGRITEARLG